MDKIDIKSEAKLLRKKGKSYKEINKILKKNIPKSTLSNWLKDIPIKKKVNLAHLVRIRAMAIRIKKENIGKRTKYFFKKNEHLKKLLEDANIGKIAIAMLYLGEGAKNPKRCSVTFGNSDPAVISLFLNLFRKNFHIDEKKLRCTVQCNLSQNEKYLKKFWQKITRIPKNQFYKTQIDKRTRKGKTKKIGYKGVCRIDYLSVETFQDIIQSIRVLTGS